MVGWLCSCHLSLGKYVLLFGGECPVEVGACAYRRGVTITAPYNFKTDAGIGQIVNIVNSTAYHLFSDPRPPHLFQFINHTATLHSFCWKYNTEFVQAASQSRSIIITAKKAEQKRCVNYVILWFSDYFRSHVLAFSSNLDELNPGVSEWRDDISRVVKSSMVQVSSAALGSYYDCNIIRNELNFRGPHSNLGS